MSKARAAVASLALVGAAVCGPAAYAAGPQQMHQAGNATTAARYTLSLSRPVTFNPNALTIDSKGTVVVGVTKAGKYEVAFVHWAPVAGFSERPSQFGAATVSLGQARWRLPAGRHSILIACTAACTVRLPSWPAQALPAGRSHYTRQDVATRSVTGLPLRQFSVPDPHGLSVAVASNVHTPDPSAATETRVCRVTPTAPCTTDDGEDALAAFSQTSDGRTVALSRDTKVFVAAPQGAALTYVNTATQLQWASDELLWLPL